MDGMPSQMPPRLVQPQTSRGISPHWRAQSGPPKPASQVHVPLPSSHAPRPPQTSLLRTGQRLTVNFSSSASQPPTAGQKRTA